MSQYTPPNVGVYTLRPSIITSSLSLNCSFNPRTLIAQVFALICATFTPGTIRSRSGMFVAPERRISSFVITKIAAATRDSFCSFFDTEVTCTFIRSSRLWLVKSRTPDSCAFAAAPAQIQHAHRNHLAALPPLLSRFALASRTCTVLFNIRMLSLNEDQCMTAAEGCCSCGP